VNEIDHGAKWQQDKLNSCSQGGTASNKYTTRLLAADTQKCLL